MECSSWKAFKDGRTIGIYDFFIHDLIIIILGMGIANLLVKSGLCNILSRFFGGALQRHASAYCFR
jgi:hypothetical protein